MPFAPARSTHLLLALVALALAACKRRNGSEAQPSPAPSIEHASSASPPSNVKTTTKSRFDEGRELYDRYCKLCHASDGSGYAADNAPSLVSPTFLKTATDEFIAHGIRAGRPGTPMAAYGKARGGPFEDGEVDAIVAFLRAKGPAAVPVPDPPLDGNAANGAVLYERHCQSCHGTNEQRGTAPTLFNGEFLASARPGFVRYAIEHGRPPTPMPAFAGTLTPSEIGDLVTWLHGLAPANPVAPPVKNPVVPKDLPVVIHPKGTTPSFELRDNRYVAAAQVKRAFDAKQRMIVIDARTPSDWIQFRIPGAIPIAYHDKHELDRLPNDGTWVIAYCACPHHASGEIVDELRKRGFPKTAVLDEGILVWKNLGYPLEGEAMKKTQTAAHGNKP